MYHGLDKPIKCKAIKLLEEYIGVNLSQLGFGNAFLDMIAETWPIIKMMSCTLLKLNFYSAKDNA